MAKTIGSFDLASLKNLRDDVTQYFWFESNSSSAWGSGAHVTLYPESQFTDSTSPNYMKGQNIIMNTDGFSIRNGGLPMMVLDNDSLDFNAVDTSLGTYTKMATFGLSGMQLYSRDSNNNLVQLANIGYGQGYDDQGQLVDAPFYTLGTRASGSAIGNYSHAEGYNTIASAYCAHAEGGTRSVIVSPETIASGEYSHAEGGSTTASAGYSHAEGYATVASGPHSHAEGFYTTAGGTNSHAGGCGTTVIKFNQTAIGEYNEIDNYADTHGKYAFIIGNGTADNARSNALTVDWYGNVEAAGEFITRQTTLNLGVYVASGILTSNAGLLTFSIPTGRVFPSGTTISKITFDILARASSANGTGYYIIESTTTGSDVASFDSSTSKTFHNANDTTKTITSAMWTKELYGGTNIYIAFSGGTDFFSGTTTIRNYINNNAAVVYLSNIVVTLSVPSA